VPLADIVEVTQRSGFSTIRRENGLRIVTVSGDVRADDPARANAVQDELRTVILPRIAEDFGVITRTAGQAEQEREFLGDAWLGFLFAMLGIYLVLAWIFASWSRPVVVMAVIPFAMTGAIWGHDVWGLPMSMFSIVGLIGMIGIVINDAIVLVSTVDDYARKRGLTPAIVDAVADRMRPILLTTATTVLGLAPLLYERSSQAIFLKPTVITLVFGLGLGMFIVLMLVPAVLAIQADWQRQRRALGRALRGRHRGAARLRAVVWVAAGLVALAFGATFGWLFAFGALPSALAISWVPPGLAALMLFLGATLGVAGLAALTGTILLRQHRRRGIAA
jgi:multidrug efflux pump subunit AcrB